MKSIKYNKLIRDRIPEIIENDGKECIYEVMDDTLYGKMLALKLNEEIAEFEAEFESGNKDDAIKELTDIQEIIFALLNYYDVDKEQFDALRKKKADKNGAFNNKYLLKEVIEND